MAARSPAARRMAMRGVRRGARDPRVRQMAGRGMARAVQDPRAQRAMQFARSERGQRMMRNVAGAYQNERQRQVQMRSMAKGGKVMKTGLVYLHKGERVVPVNMVNKVEKGLRNMGINLRLPKANNTVKVAANKLRKLSPRSMVKGGKVMKTGPHKVAKGQRVISINKVSNVDKILRRK